MQRYERKVPPHDDACDTEVDTTCSTVAQGQARGGCAKTHGSARGKTQGINEDSNQAAARWFSIVVWLNLYLGVTANPTR
jgi:hypothetical protein